MQKLDFSKILPKGSVLVFSLLILSIMLVTSLTILSSALLNQKASLSTGSGARSFQVADSGVEKVLYEIYKKNNTTLSALATALGGSPAPSCSNGIVSFSVAGGKAEVSFHKSDPSTPGATIPYTNCGTPNGEWRDQVVKIKSEGTAGSTTRAVEVAVAATGEAYDMSCARDTNDDIAGCCRINKSNGEMKCSYKPDASTWSSSVVVLSSISSGIYSVSCKEYDIITPRVQCCRFDQSSGQLTTNSCVELNSGGGWSGAGTSEPSF